MFAYILAAIQIMTQTKGKLFKIQLNSGFGCFTIRKQTKSDRKKIIGMIESV